MAFASSVGMVFRFVFLGIAGLAVLSPPQPGVSRTLAGSVQTHVVVPGDTLRTVGARFGVAEAVLREDNPVAANGRITAGQTLRVDTRHIVPVAVEGVPVVVNVPQRHLFLDDGGDVRAYPIAVGRADWQTPTGPFVVVDKEEDPAWDVPLSIQAEMRREGKPVQTRVAPGPDNPLGKYFVRLSFTSVGLHGTIAPASIYRAATHGCIRLHPDDIAAVFARVPVGAAGRSIYEPVLLAHLADGIYLEAHPDIYRRTSAASALADLREMAEAGDLSAAIDWAAARQVLARRTGTARLVSPARTITD